MERLRVGLKVKKGKIEWLKSWENDGKRAIFQRVFSRSDWQTQPEMCVVLHSEPSPLPCCTKGTTNGSNSTHLWGQHMRWSGSCFNHNCHGKPTIEEATWRVDIVRFKRSDTSASHKTIVTQYIHLHIQSKSMNAWYKYKYKYVESWLNPQQQTSSHLFLNARHIRPPPSTIFSVPRLHADVHDFRGWALLSILRRSGGSSFRTPRNPLWMATKWVNMGQYEKGFQCVGSDHGHAEGVPSGDPRIMCRRWHWFVPWEQGPSSLSVLKLSFHISINVHKVHKTKDPETWKKTPSSMALVMLTQAEPKPNPSLVAFQNDGNDQVHHLRRETAQQKIPSGTFVRGSNFAESPQNITKLLIPSCQTKNMGVLKTFDILWWSGHSWGNRPWRWWARCRSPELQRIEPGLSLSAIYI